MAHRRTSVLMMAAGDDHLEFDAQPLQGSWTEEQYLRLSAQTNRLIELVDGRIEVVPMPTEEHQALVEWLFLALRAFLLPRGGVVRFAPLRLRIRPGRFREPDILLVRDAADPRRQNDYWRGADLVVEVVSPDKPERDLIDKRGAYAEAQIPEYWIVNPQSETITVLCLEGPADVEHGVFGCSVIATSVVLEGFSVIVDAVFDAE